MSKKIIAGILLGTLVCVVGISIAQAPAPALANFKIVVTVDQTQNGVVMTCEQGCAWETLSFSCAMGEKCASPVTQHGMGK